MRNSTSLRSLSSIGALESGVTITLIAMAYKKFRL
jgi:hypothetical protein